MEWMDMHLQIYIYAHTCVNIYMCVCELLFLLKPGATNQLEMRYIYMCVFVCVSPDQLNIEISASYGSQNEPGTVEQIAD